MYELDIIIIYTRINFFQCVVVLYPIKCENCQDMCRRVVGSNEAVACI